MALSGDALFSKPTKRKRAQTSRAPPAKKSRKTQSSASQKKPAKSRSKRDEELDSQHSESDDDAGAIDDLDLRESDIDENASGDEIENETAAQKRLRLAKLYLQSVKDDIGEGEVDAADLDRELVASRLRQDVLQQSGRIHLSLADSISASPSSSYPSLHLKGHRFSITSAVVSESGQFLFTAGKEGSIIKWDAVTGKRLHTFPKVRPPSSDSKKDRKGKGKMTAEAHAASEIHGHTDEVLALALSSDGKLLVSGGRDRRIGVWDAEKNAWIRSFGGHRDTISALVFRKGSQTLYTASFDRTLKSFDLGAMGYVETLFGHQDPVTSIDALRGEIALSAGGQDRTVRYWKIVDETQLVFRGGGKSKLRDMIETGGIDEDEEAETSKNVRREGFVEGRIECVAMIDDTTFLSGGDSGSISLWSTLKKKPLFTYATAHGIIAHTPDPLYAATFTSSFGSSSAVQNPRWITSLASLPYSDLFASGSWDGEIRLWRIEMSNPSSSSAKSRPNTNAQPRSFSPLRTISIPGIINSLQLVRAPPGAMSSASWFPPNHAQSEKEREKEQDILLVAGVGQEPRLGRWMTVKGEKGKEGGAKNAAYVFALSRPIAGTVPNGHSKGEGMDVDDDEDDDDE